MFSPYLVDLTGLSTSVEAALRLGILSVWIGGDGKCERQPRVNKSPLVGREREAIRGKIEVAYRSSNNLCFLEPDESTRVCHDAYSQPYFGTRRGNAPMHAEEELRSLLCHDGGVICRRQKAIEMEVVMDEGSWRFVEMCYRGAWSFYDGALNGCTFPVCNLTSPPRSCFNCHRFPRNWIAKHLLYVSSRWASPVLILMSQESQSQTTRPKTNPAPKPSPGCTIPEDIKKPSKTKINQKNTHLHPAASHSRCPNRYLNTSSIGKVTCILSPWCRFDTMMNSMDIP
jgi:hypothetical protein